MLNKILLQRLKDTDPGLSSLNLKDRSFNEEDILPLMEYIAQNTTLTRLDLANIKIGDAGAIALARNTSLIQLNWI